MATVLRFFSEYFIRNADHKDSFSETKKSYYNKSERTFVFMNEADTAGRQEYIEIPRLLDTDLYRKYLRIHGYTHILEEYHDKPEEEFAAAVRFYADKVGIEDDLDAYLTHRVDDYMYDWAVEHNLKNWKVCLSPLEDIVWEDLWKLGDREANRILNQHWREQLQREQEDEERLCSGSVAFRNGFFAIYSHFTA